MNEPSSRGGRAGAVLVTALIAGSAGGAIGWHLGVNNSRRPPLDDTGFDINSAPAAPRLGAFRSPSAESAGPVPAPQSGLSMIQSDPKLRLAAPGARPGTTAPGSPANNAGSSAGNFKAAMQHWEGNYKALYAATTSKHPVIARYNAECLKYEDIRRINEAYWRDHDPMAFLIGMAKSPNFAKVTAKYASSPEVRDYAVDVIKHAPGELLTAAMDAMRQENVVRDFVSNAASGMGLPPGITAMFGGGTKLDQSQFMKQVMNDPNLKH